MLMTLHDICRDFKGNVRFVKCLFCIAPFFVNVCDCLAVRVEKCNLPSLTHWRICTWRFLLSFHRVLLCGIARVSAHDCEIEFNSHTATGGETPVSLEEGKEEGVKYREITIIMFFLSTQTQYPADGITKIPVFIARELANSGIQGIFGYKRSISVCQYLNYC